MSARDFCSYHKNQSWRYKAELFSVMLSLIWCYHLPLYSNFNQLFKFGGLAIFGCNTTTEKNLWFHLLFNFWFSPTVRDLYPTLADSPHITPVVPPDNILASKSVHLLCSYHITDPGPSNVGYKVTWYKILRFLGGNHGKLILLTNTTKETAVVVNFESAEFNLGDTVSTELYNYPLRGYVMSVLTPNFSLHRFVFCTILEHCKWSCHSKSLRPAEHYFCAAHVLCVVLRFLCCVMCHV